MTLAEFFKHSPMTKALLAERLGVSPITINRYLDGSRFPSKETILAIAKLTGEQVRPADWFSEAPKRPVREQAARDVA